MKAVCSNRGIRRSLAALAAFACVAPACVDDVGLVNRTSPDKIDKQLFEGVWIYSQTVVDAPYSSAVSFTGAQNFRGSSKIVFDIQEDFLVAYPVVETVENSEREYKTQKIRKYWEPGARDEFIELYVGSPVARWPIEKHFDVIRDYNEYNGSQSNVAVENAEDRPWYERDYIRVSWNAQQLPQGIFPLGQGGAHSDYESRDAREGPNAMTVDADGGYFDFVVRERWQASGQDMCNVYGLSRYDCDPAEVKVRHSFKRLDPKRDYEPLRYHNNEHQDKFGYFLTERPYYDQDWGPSYEGRVFYANRWNLWKDNFDYDKPTGADGTPQTITCTTDQDCNREAGERCQKDEGWFEQGYCAEPEPRPYHQRELNPVIFHLSADWPEHFRRAAYASAEGWNESFKKTVSWMLFHEERGQYNPRRCETNADCVTQNVLVDEQFPVRVDGIPCHDDAACGDGSSCGDEGFCVEQRSCDADNPCAVGQTCADGVCMQGGEPVQERLTSSTQQSGSVVYHGNGDRGYLVTRDRFSTSQIQALSSDEAYVRLIHAAPEAGDIGARINGVTIEGGGFDPQRSYDPADSATEPFLAAVPGGQNVSVEIVRSGEVIAEETIGLQGGASQMIIYNGAEEGSGIVAPDLSADPDQADRGTSFTASERGVRLVHANADEAYVNDQEADGEEDAEARALDFGLKGVRVAESVRYEHATAYESISGASQRATVTWAGTRGDLTCYQAEDGIGRCVGWGERLSKQDLDRRKEIEQSLPDLFILCENQYDELEALDQANVDAGRQTRQSAMEPRVDGKPAEDAYFGDAWYSTRANARYYGGPDATAGSYNPCGDSDLVPHPERLKKAGDTRYSLFYWVPDPQRAGPLGYGPSISDPSTGEIISATANIYGGGLRTYGRYAKDIIRLVNGELKQDDIITGEWIREAMANRQGGGDAESDARFGTRSGGLGQGSASDGDDGGAGADDRPQPARQAPDRAPQSDGVDLPTAGEARGQLASATEMQPYQYTELLQYLDDPEKLEQDMKKLLPQVNLARNQRRLEKIEGTWIEDLMVNDEVMTAADAIDPSGEKSRSELMDELSPTAWASKHKQRQRERRIDLLSQNRIFLGEFVDATLVGLANELKDRGVEGEALRLALTRRILRGVTEHEVGHAIGLRHNFSGSADVFNYKGGAEDVDNDDDKELTGYYGARETEPLLCEEDTQCDELTGQVCATVSCNPDDDADGNGISDDCEALGDNFTCVQGTCTTGGPDDAISVCADPVSDESCDTDDDCADGNTCFEQTCYDPDEQYVPRAEITAQEREEGQRTQYQYASIMDYGGRVNSHFHGLGKYDHAAIRFGYGQLVDTYADTSKLDERIQQAADVTGRQPSQYSRFRNSDVWANRGLGFFHPFNYLNNYIGVRENLERTPRPYMQVKYQEEMVVNDTRRYLDLAFVEVPYAFCSDEFRGNLGCYAFDEGVDAVEMARHSVDKLEEYYIFDAFKRQRLYYGTNPFNYYRRVRGRYMNVLGDVGMYYAFYDSFLHRFSWYTDWKQNPLGGRTYKRAAEQSFGYLQDIVASPAPGSFRYDEDEGAYVNVSFETDMNGDGDPNDPSIDDELNVPLGVGRFPFTRYGYELGYQYANHPLWIGSFWEKLAGLITLTDSTARFPQTAVGEQLDIGVGTSLGYNTVFSDRMNAFLGGIIAGEKKHYAGRVVQDGYRAPSSDAAANNQGEPVEPALDSLTLKLYSAVFGMANLPAGFDPQFIDATAVFLEGDAYEYDANGEVEKYTFEDPIGGKTYVAFSNNYADFGVTAIAPGATLVQKASKLGEQWRNATGEERRQLADRITRIREVLDVLRGLNQIYGSSSLGL